MKNRAGRPKADEAKQRSEMIACRVTKALKTDLYKEASRADESVTEIVNIALQQFVNRKRGDRKRMGPRQ